MLLLLLRSATATVNVAVDMRGGNVCSNTFALNTVTMQKAHIPKSYCDYDCYAGKLTSLSHQQAQLQQRASWPRCSCQRHTLLATRHTPHTLNAARYTPDITRHTSHITQIIDSTAAEAVVGKGGGVLFLCG